MTTTQTRVIGTTGSDTVRGRFDTIEGRRVYVIDGASDLRPFLTTVVSDSNLWMYVSTSGALTAGRESAEKALFPYVTDDNLHRYGGISGPVTLIRDADGGQWYPWDPRGAPRDATRRIIRGLQADFVAFEEYHAGLGLTFRQSWHLSDVFGVVRRSVIEVDEGSSKAFEGEVVDGLLNVMPAGGPLVLQQRSSTLIDGYARSELDPRTGLGLFALEAAITDRAAPIEALRTNVIWSVGMDGADITLDPDAWHQSLRGERFVGRSILTGQRAAYVRRMAVSIAPGSRREWAIVGDTSLDHERLEMLTTMLGAGVSIADVMASVDEGVASLGTILDLADGAQASADEAQCAYHRSNTLFNAMRGGVLIDGYRIDAAQFGQFLESRNRPLADGWRGVFSGLGERPTIAQIRAAAEASGDADLIRLTLEYLPLTFGRRHGDPSRPWNAFHIRLRDERGKRITGYEGNWRDIFQNWVAMSQSCPDALPGIVAKFLNASTADGFNPYRISDAGIDWEVPEPDDPWAHIGYWGDHQIVYLLEALEALQDWRPGYLESLLDKAWFSYADVPYRLKDWTAISENPKSTIDFDKERDAKIRERAKEIGSDARLVHGEGGGVVHATLLEKLLVPTLSKVSNLVPGGGIWMNTQRPDWNDANNALVGDGLSMVTLFQLRRFTDFCVQLLSERDHGDILLHAEVAEWCDGVLHVLVEHLPLVQSDREITDAERWEIMRMLGQAFSRYRERLYGVGLGHMRQYPTRAVTDLFRLARHYCDDAIRSTERDDGLFESYMLLQREPRSGKAGVDRLYPMLEGQVAALSAGVLEGNRAADLIDRMYETGLYRADLDTFILYPTRDRLAFQDRNIVPEEAVTPNGLLEQLADTRTGEIAYRDQAGHIRFEADLVSSEALEAALSRLSQKGAWRTLVASDRDNVLAAYEATFNHRAFTGRSGTMHKFEGNGCVYWHMVSRMLLGVQRCVFEAIDRADAPDIVGRLARSYHRVRAGLGFNHAPGVFGAIPFEPYSHSPLHAGAQQPGMTGQVKEGLLARMGELGVRVIAGEIQLDPILLRRDEFLTAPIAWNVQSGDGEARELRLGAGELGFTVCATPFVLRIGETPSVRVFLTDGTEHAHQGLTVPAEWTREIADRSGRVLTVRATVPEAILYRD